MKEYSYDKKSDALMITLKEGKEERFEEIAPGINAEFDKDDKIIGIEILNASRFSPQSTNASPTKRKVQTATY